MDPTDEHIEALRAHTEAIKALHVEQERLAELLRAQGPLLVGLINGQLGKEDT